MATVELVIEYEFDGLVSTTSIHYGNEVVFERMMKKDGFEDIRALYSKIGATVLHILKVEKSHVAL